jgi:hypothetical protein
MENPWISLPMEAPCVSEPDKPAVAAFNVHASDEHRIHTDVLPEPFLGRKDAPIVLLNVNPGFDDHASLTHEDHYARDAWKKNILHEPLAYPFYFLDPQLSHAGGARWWKRTLRELMQIAGAHPVANTIF